MSREADYLVTLTAVIQPGLEGVYHLGRWNTVFQSSKFHSTIVCGKNESLYPSFLADKC